MHSSEKILPSTNCFMTKKICNPVDKLKRIKKQEQKADRTKLFYEVYKNMYDSTTIQTIHSFSDTIKNFIVAMHTEHDKHNN